MAKKYWSVHGREGFGLQQKEIAKQNNITLIYVNHSIWLFIIWDGFHH